MRMTWRQVRGLVEGTEYTSFFTFRPRQGRTMHSDDMTRRSFFNRAQTYALGGLAGAGALQGLVPTRAWARQPARPQNWLTLTDEAALEPELPIIDPHHHLWDRPGNRYLLEELLEDTREHNVRQTVFVECSSMYRADGPEELRVVG